MRSWLTCWKGMCKRPTIKSLDIDIVQSRAKAEMCRLLDKHPQGLAGFEGDSTLTRSREPQTNPTLEAGQNTGWN